MIAITAANETTTRASKASARRRRAWPVRRASRRARTMRQQAEQGQLGNGSLPSMTSSIAFSSPNRYSSGPATMVTLQSPQNPAVCNSCTARVTASISRRKLAFKQTNASAAPIANAAIATPSTSWYGFARSNARSLKVPGSPSAPLQTQLPADPRLGGDPRPLLARGKPTTTSTSQPRPRHDVDRGRRAQLAGHANTRPAGIGRKVGSKRHDRL